VPPTADPSSSSATSTTVAPEYKPAVAPLVPVPVPPSAPAEPEQVVPPSPKPQHSKQEESEGVMSGSVVPPGSTGTDSEGETSFTDDDDAGKELDEQEAEDDEERLIMQGGAGIPIGPVSGLLFVRDGHSPGRLMSLGWSTKTFTASDFPISRRAQVSCVGSR
jgi:RNA polymerase II subunit A small phosphatase-like protein